MVSSGFSVDHDGRVVLLATAYLPAETVPKSGATSNDAGVLHLGGWGDSRDPSVARLVL